MKARLILFDVGGTLLRTARPVGETYAQLARHYGRDWDPAELQQAFREAWRQQRRRGPGTVPRDGDDRAWWREVVRVTVGERAEDGAFPFEHYFEELYGLFAQPALWRVYPEVWGVLDQLAATGVELGVLSNWDSRLHALIEGLELGEYFPRHRRWISAEIGAVKPDPEIYARVVRDAGLSPAEIFHCGDDPENDEVAARRAGWRARSIARPEETLLVVLEELAGSASR